MVRIDSSVFVALGMMLALALVVLFGALVLMYEEGRRRYLLRLAAQRGRWYVPNSIMLRAWREWDPEGTQPLRAIPREDES